MDPDVDLSIVMPLDSPGYEFQSTLNSPASHIVERQRLIYIADLALELHRLSERCGCVTLAELFRVAHTEAIVKVQEKFTALATKP